MSTWVCPSPWPCGPRVGGRHIWCSATASRVFIAAGSLRSPSVRQDQPESWPDNFEMEFAEPTKLRDWYARARVVIVPSSPRLSVGRHRNSGGNGNGQGGHYNGHLGTARRHRGRVNGLLVQPGDAETLRDFAWFLPANERERRRLGANARGAATSRFGLEAYADQLAAHLQELGARAALTTAS